VAISREQARFKLTRRLPSTQVAQRHAPRICTTIAGAALGVEQTPPLPPCTPTKAPAAYLPIFLKDASKAAFHNS